MKYYRKYTNAFRVNVSESDIQKLWQKWPCSKLCHGDRAWFEFDSTTGDLLNYQVIHSHAGHVDRGECESILALADITKDYGLKKQTK